MQRRLKDRHDLPGLGVLFDRDNRVEQRSTANFLQEFVQRAEWRHSEDTRVRQKRDHSRLLLRSDCGGGRSRSEQRTAQLQPDRSIVSVPRDEIFDFGVDTHE